MKLKYVLPEAAERDCTENIQHGVILRKTYHRALLVVHPDRLTSHNSSPIERAVATKAFIVLQDVHAEHQEDREQEV